MKLREHDKQALQIIATNKSVGGRYYDFEAFLFNFSTWARSGVMPITFTGAKQVALSNYFCFLDPEAVLMAIDKVISNLKSNNKNQTKYLAFELYFLVPISAKEERDEKEKLLRKQLKYKKGCFLSSCTKARESFQELIRRSMLKLLDM